MTMATAVVYMDIDCDRTKQSRQHSTGANPARNMIGTREV